MEQIMIKKSLRSTFHETWLYKFVVAIVWATIDVWNTSLQSDPL